MLNNLNQEIISSLNKCEKDFIYSSLEIAHSGPNSNSPYRFWFNDFKKYFKTREGDIYEFGVFRGASLLSIALLAKRLNSKKHFWGFDTFQGFPALSKLDNLRNFSEDYGFSKEHIEDVNLLSKIRLNKEDLKEKNLNISLTKLGKSGLFNDTSYEDLLQKIERFSLDNITLIKGEFKETVYQHFSQKKRKVFSANIDCDLYEGYKICLPWVFNNLEKNGFINLDEYHSLKYPGPKIATDEFLDANKDAILRESPTNQYEFGRFYITK